MQLGFSAYEAPTVWHGLAAEEALLDAAREEIRVLLWRCPAAVVFGKHQVPQRECDLAWCVDNGLHVARRISGGGAVVQDPGSWSVAVILPRETYQVDRVYTFFTEIIRRLGVSGANRRGEGVFVGDHKVSGHAYCYRRQHVVHHGTLLLESDLGRLRRALQPPTLNLRTHAVPSQSAPVVNLVDLGADSSGVSMAVQEALSEWGDLAVMPMEDPAPSQVEAIAGWDRVYGGTPRFFLSAENHTWEVYRGRVVGEAPVRFTAGEFSTGGAMPPVAGLFPEQV